MATCVDIERALSPGAPLVHDSEPDNVAGFMKQSTGNVDKAFAEADYVIKETLRVHRTPSKPAASSRNTSRKKAF